MKLRESCFWDHEVGKVYLHRDKETQHLLSFPDSKLPWLKLLRTEQSLGDFLSSILNLENRLPLAEAITFINLLAQTSYLEVSNLPIDLEKELEPKQAHSFIAEENKDELIKALQENAFFDFFPQQTIERIATQSSLKSYEAGAFILRQSDRADDFFVLLRGNVSVYVKKPSGTRERVCVLREGTVFGESAFRGDAFRGADVFSKDGTQLLIIPPQEFLKLAQENLETHALNELDDRIFLSQYLSTSPLFQHLPSEALSLFVRSGERVELTKDQVLFQEGDRGDAFYLIVRGEMLVLQDQKDPALLKQGDCLGEIALLKGVPRTATVKAFEDSVLLRISSIHFWKILFQNLGLALMLEEVAESRYKGQVLTLT
jgi:CRP-like cAMP-binding protein